jgi:hypothetical protein
MVGGRNLSQEVIVNQKTFSNVWSKIYDLWCFTTYTTSDSHVRKDITRNHKITEIIIYFSS